MQLGKALTTHIVVFFTSLHIPGVSGSGLTAILRQGAGGGHARATGRRRGEKRRRKGEGQPLLAVVAAVLGGCRGCGWMYRPRTVRVKGLVVGVLGV